MWSQLAPSKKSPITPIPPTRVLILGGGFGGIYTAMQLEHLTRKNPTSVEITLVNDENFMVFTPLLHEVASSELDPTSVVNPIHRLLKRARFFCGEVQSINLKQKTVSVSHGVQEHEHNLHYDHLVLGLGSVTNFHNLPGLERAFTMKGLGDAIALRNQLISILEEADFECEALNREELLTIVVVGGGFAGVETAAAIHDYIFEVAERYPRLADETIRVVLVHDGNVLLPELSPSLGKYTEKILRKRGLDIRLGIRLAKYEDHRAELANGEQIPTATLVWTAGVAPSPLVSSLPCEKIKGRVLVDQFLQVKDFPNVWALGDCAAIPKADEKSFHPPTAQHAVREAKILACNICATLSNRPLKQFKFNMLGQLASLGKHRGVAQVFGFQFSGFCAWWLWRTVYLLKLPRFERKMRVAIDWMFDIFFAKDSVQIPIWRSSSETAQIAKSLPAHGETNPQKKVVGV